MALHIYGLMLATSHICLPSLVPKEIRQTVHASYDIIFNVGIYTDIIDAIREYYEDSLTEPESDEKRIENRDRNDLPVGREVKDQDAFLREKVHQFEEHASEKELEEIDEHAHNAE